MRAGPMASLLLAMAASGWAQTIDPAPQVRFKQKADVGLTVKRAVLAPADRLRKAMEADPDSAAMTKLVSYALLRGLEGRAGGSNDPIDRAVQSALRRHPQADRGLLQRFAGDVVRAPMPRGAMPLSMNLADTSKPIPAVELDRIRAGFLKTAVARGPKFSVVEAGRGKLPNLAQEFLDRLNHPHITGMDPRTSKGYEPGQRISIYGWKFSPDKTRNRLVIYKVMGNGSLGELTRVAPAVCSETAMEVVLPANLEAGNHRCKVVVTGTGGEQDESLVVPLPVKSPAPPAPSVSSVVPSKMVPGREAIIAGANFANQANRLAFVYLAPMDGQELPFSVRVAGDPCVSVMAQVLNGGQAAVTMPRVLQPGRYRLALSVGGALSAWTPVEVAPLQYMVRFTQIHCLDESDPEKLGHDEIFTMWCIVRDGMAHAKSVGDHKEYYNWDDGDWDRYHPDDQNVFPPNDDASVKQALAIATTLYEWDAGDMKKVNEVIGVASEVTQAILTYKGDKQTAELVKALTPVLQKVVTWFGGSPDYLGTQTMGWSAMELAALTDNPEKRFAGRLEFRNNDDTGSYEVFYEVMEKP